MKIIIFSNVYISLSLLILYFWMKWDLYSVVAIHLFKLKDKFGKGLKLKGTLGTGELNMASWNGLKK